MGEIPILVEIRQIVTVEVVFDIRDTGIAHHVPTDFGEGIRKYALKARITGFSSWGCHVVF